MLFTTNKEGPSVRNVEEYLNTFIPTICSLLSIVKLHRKTSCTFIAGCSHKYILASEDGTEGYGGQREDGTE